MYFFRTTTTPRPTTERWFGFEFGDYYFYDGGPEPFWDEKPDYFFEDKTKEDIIEQSDIADHIVSFIGLALNIIHLSILLRKELRSNVVFIIILGISLCDILICTGSITERYFKDSHKKGSREGFCGTDEQWWMVFIQAISQGIQKFGRLTEALFALSTAVIRAITVLYPMSSVADSLMKVSSGIIIVAIDTVVCGLLIACYYSTMQFPRYGMLITDCYFLSNPTYYRDILTNLEGYCILFLTIMYLIFTLILLISLAIVKKKRKNLKNEKSSNTSMLVMLMAIAFFVSNLVYSLVFILDSRYSDNQNSVLVQLVDVFNYISRIILTFNSIFHCLICFFLSSQYREAAKRLVCRKQKEEIAEASTYSTVRTTRTSRDSGY